MSVIQKRTASSRTIRRKYIGDLLEILPVSPVESRKPSANGEAAITYPGMVII
jgi:hypothetical protein